MSHAEWRTWVSPAIDYITQCPDLLLPTDEPIKQSALSVAGGTNWIIKNWMIIISLLIAAMLALVTYRIMLNRRTAPIPAAESVRLATPPSSPSQSSTASVSKQTFPPPGKGRPTAFLFCVEGTAKGQRYPIDHTLYRIGADENNELQLRDEFVSRKHACVKYDSGNLYLSDSGSRNGTFLNDSPLQQAAALKPGDLIRMGKTTLALIATHG
jgi:hypothetical protein